VPVTIRRAPTGGPEIDDDAMPTAGRGRLLVVLVLLAVLLAGLAVAKRRSDFWPLVSWPVYDDVTPDGPDPTESLLEVRARDVKGRTHVLRVEDLVEASREQLADLALEGALEDEAGRAYLGRLVDRRVDEDVERVELWELTFEVDPDAVPPIDLDDPLSERRRVVIRADDDGRAG
jgi:hypothetical protein